jgi:hypothetical protein
VSLQFAEELESIKIDFGPELNTQLNELVNEFDDVTQEPQGLPPHRGTFDYTIRLTAYPKRQRRNRLFVLEYEELKRQCGDLFKRDSSVCLIVLMLHPLFWFGNLMVLIGYVSIT